MADLTFTPLLVTLLALSVIFDFINGFHDTANAVATVISTRVLSPWAAIIMAGVLNFAGAVTGTAVAQTVGSGIVGTQVPLLAVASALVGAILWNVITWYFGIPSSSSHALIGGLIGAGAGALGVGAVHWDVLAGKVLLPLVASPVAGFVIALLLMKAFYRIFATMAPARVGRLFRRSQILSAAFMAFSHGGNDAQKTMGIITLGLVSAGALPRFQVPLWVILLSATTMALGTAAGGRRIIHTMGMRLTHLEPIHGFTAETSAALVIETASRLGFPLSTTHVIGAAILGVGSARRMNAVRWDVVGNMVRAWIFTIPTSAALSLVAFLALRLVLGTE